MFSSRLHDSLFAVLSALVVVQLTPACHSSQSSSEQREEKEEGKEEEEGDEEEAMDPAKMPEPVRASAQKYFADLSACKATHEGAAGAAVFEVVGKNAEGRALSLNFGASGSVLEVEQEVAVDGLPAAVRDTLAHKYGSAAVKKAEAVELHFYEVRLTNKDGKSFEVRVSGAGQVMEDAK